ncbi:MAG: toll/interleukin-1 receptor domain-containing protein [Anaerolineae bacterium]|nr:toll/interleukin-1 receptor domain-containing protein [Anaerolineae bacterium]
MSHIFISYSKQDMEFMRYLRVLLEAEGFAVWVDEQGLTPSSRWWKMIEQNIEDCAALIVIMSVNSAESDWVEREILLAEKLKRPLFPVLLSGEAWSRLANIQYEDMRAGLRAKLSARLVNSLRNRVPTQKAGEREIRFSIEHGDISTFEADVAAFKYAGTFHGADRAVGARLVDVGVPVEAFVPEKGAIDAYRYTPTQGAVAAPHVLYVVTPILRHFGYKQIRQFAVRVLEALAEAAPHTRHLAMTTHGPGMSLDEQEALFSQFAGFMDALNTGSIPPGLRHITIVEISKDRSERLRTMIDNALAGAEYARKVTDGWGYMLRTLVAGEAAATGETSQVISAGTPNEKPHAVALVPADGDLEDVFYYGIQSPVHAMGLLCERVEDALLSEDLFESARQRIETAHVVIAELTGADTNVYLQLGYALGKARPVVLLAQDGQTVRFELRGQRPLFYRRIKDVEALLAGALDHLKAEGKL